VCFLVVNSEDSWEKTATDLSDVDTPIVSARRNDADVGEDHVAATVSDIGVALPGADPASLVNDAAQAVLDTSATGSAATGYDELSADGVSADVCITLDPHTQVCLPPCCCFCYMLKSCKCYYIIISICTSLHSIFNSIVAVYVTKEEIVKHMATEFQGELTHEDILQALDADRELAGNEQVLPAPGIVL